MAIRLKDVSSNLGRIVPVLEGVNADLNGTSVPIASTVTGAINLVLAGLVANLRGVHVQNSVFSGVLASTLDGVYVLRVSAQATGSTSISLAWPPLPRAVSYRVYRNDVLIASPATNSYQDSGRTPSTTYNYRVAAVYSDGTIGPQSPVASATTQAAGANTVVPAVYPLELVSPRAVGSLPSNDVGTPAMPSGHRIFKAYPGIEYNIRAVVIGGSYPYTFSLSNAPAGMTINSTTGEISWPNPQSNATPTITVTDSEGTVRSSPWTITVATTGFRFADAVNGNDSWDGTAPAFVSGTTGPWRTLLQVYNAGGNNTVYLRQGSYSTTGLPRNSSVPLVAGTVDTSTFTPANRQFETSAAVAAGATLAFTSGANASWAVFVNSVASQNGKTLVTIREDVPNGALQNGDQFYFQNAGWVRVTFSASSPRPVQFIGYPGESAALDMGFTGFSSDFGAFIAWRGNATYPIYLDNLTIRNHLYMLNQFETGYSSHYNVVRRINYRDLIEGIDGVNSGCLDHRSSSTRDQYACYQDLNSDSTVDAGLIKDYNLKKFLWEDLVWNGANGGPDIKAVSDRFEVRRCRGIDPYGGENFAGIFGNMNGGEMDGEIRYNFIRAAGKVVCAVNQDSVAGNIHIYRNTFVGRISVLGITDATDGPFVFKNNVIMNDDSAFLQRIGVYSAAWVDGGAITAPQANVVLGTGAEANLAGASNSNIVDANGNLTAAYVDYRGTHGWETP